MRGRVVAIAVGGALVGSGLTVAWVELTGRNCLDLGPVDQIEAHRVYEAACADAVVVSAVPEPIVFLARTPHLPGEPLTWDEAARVFIGLHGEEYTASGERVTGPGRPTLDRCPVATIGGRLWIEAMDAEPASLEAACDQAP